MRPRRLPVSVRLVDAGQLQRRVGQVDFTVRKLADRFQRSAGVAHSAAGVLSTSGSGT